MNTIPIKLILISLFSLFFITSFAQETESPLKIFFVNSTYSLDYIRKEISYVNYVRDRHEAEVVILESQQTTGNGGKMVYFYFMGQKSYQTLNDTLTISVNPDETEEQQRTKAVAIIKAGLVRYIARTSFIDKITIKSESVSDTTSGKQIDKWNSWVFKLSGNGYFNGEKSYLYRNIYTNVSAERITEDLKFEASISYSSSRSKYVLEEYDTTLIANTQSIYNNFFLAKSISNHFSIGSSLGANSSTYSNLDFSGFFQPAIEYNIFPYSESTRKQFRIQYRNGISYKNYTDTTIYFKMEEYLWSQSLNIAVAFVQKWGSVNVSLYGSNYFHDFSKNQLSFDASAEINLFKGLSFTLYGYYSFTRNQLSLPKGGASFEEMITRQRELQTQFNYYTSVGLSYTFGSIYNNVVNPRFQ